MTDTIRITASLRIDRPVDIVRAQYRDIDHHIRNNVHPSIKYQWEPGAPSERKIRTTFRILGVPQFDVSLLEDGADGTFIIRYLEGSNAGMVLVHRFVPVGDSATDVQLVADAPSTPARRFLGPLFVAGARQVMKKALAEDKRDIERHTYVPGHAAGDLEGVLSDVAVVASKDAPSKRAVLEAACIVSAADGDVDPAERDAIGRLARVVGAADDAKWIEARLTELSQIAATERIAGEADRIGAALSASRVASEGILAAVLVGLVSQGMSLGELAIVRRIAVSAGIAEETLGPTVDAADERLNTG